MFNLKQVIVPFYLSVLIISAVFMGIVYHVFWGSSQYANLKRLKTVIEAEGTHFETTFTEYVLGCYTGANGVLWIYYEDDAAMKPDEQLKQRMLNWVADNTTERRVLIGTGRVYSLDE